MDKDCYNKKNVLLDHLQNDVSFREKLVFLQKQKLEKRNSKKKMVQESIKGCTSKHDDQGTKQDDCTSKQLTLKNIVLYLKEKPELRVVLLELTKFVKLLLTIPGSSCTNE